MYNVNNPGERVSTIDAMTNPRAFDPEAMQAQADEAARLLRALANPHRLRIVCMLVGHELTVGQLNQRLPDLSQSGLSQHLARLREEGVVETRRESQQIWYQLVDGPGYRLIGALHGIYCSTPDPSPVRKRGATVVGRRQKRSVIAK